MDTVLQDEPNIQFIVFPAVQRSMNGGPCCSSGVDEVNKRLREKPDFNAYHKAKYGENAVIMPCQCDDCQRKYLS